jgi:3-hydroxyisobutyrate dehydrogenase
VARIAFFGLGRMGSGMAGRLLDAGHEVTLWNRTRGKASGLLTRGAGWADTPIEAATGADAAFAMLADDPASLEVWLGSNGAMEGLTRGAFVIECSTLSHPHVLELAAAARTKGLRYIDCPVTGWPHMAAAGELTLLIGADRADLEGAQPVLAPLCKSIRVFGGVGAGTGYKLMINLMGSVQIAALAEGLALSQRLGLDREAVAAAIEAGAAASPQVVRHCRPMAEGRYAADPVFSTALRHKDASYGLALAESQGVASPLGAAATEWWSKASTLDAGGDEARLIEVVTQHSTKMPGGKPPG